MNTFFQSVSLILERESADLSKETRKTYRFVLSKFERAFPRIQCAQITPDVIQEFREKMLRQGNCNNTISKTLAALKTLINKVRHSGMIQTDPFANIRIRKVYSTRHYLTTDELQFLHSHFLTGRQDLSRPEQDAVLAFLFPALPVSAIPI